MADHILAVSIEADGDDVHAYLHWGETWKHLTPLQKARIIEAMGDAMQDAADDVEAESRAEVIRALIASTGCTPAQALDRIERLERVAAIMSDPDDWDVEYD
jgi:acyl-CoA reductase-like NAD-dependent aldehyde dehydrogenase